MECYSQEKTKPSIDNLKIGSVKSNSNSSAKLSFSEMSRRNFSVVQKWLRLATTKNASIFPVRNLSEAPSSAAATPSQSQQGGLAKAMEKFTGKESFVKLLRNSHLVQVVNKHKVFLVKDAL